MSKITHPAIKELVLDILKPYSPSLTEFALSLCNLEYVNIVDISLVEMNEKTESLKVVIHGVDIDFDGMKDYIGKKGASIQSVDNVVVKMKEARELD